MSNTRTSNYLFLSLLVLFTSAACSGINNDDTDLITEPELYKLGEFTDNGITVAAYSTSPLLAGYHDIYLEVHREGVRVEPSDIGFTPMMQMEESFHSSPSSDPATLRDSEHNLYRTWAIFTMPGGMMGSWELQLAIYNSSNSTGPTAEGVIAVEVGDSNRVKSFLADDERSYLLTLVSPGNPEVGLNDLVVALHKRESMMEFLPVQDAGIGFEPWMPAMDHGSSNNVSPVHHEDGFYHGKVNFNMSGGWELRFDLSINGGEPTLHVFELDF